MPLYDLECQSCGHKHEMLANYQPSPIYAGIECPGCGRYANHKRLPSLIAPYFGEKILNPEVMGGSFDTMGKGKVARLPEFREAAEHDAKLTAAINQLPPDAPMAAVRDTMASIGDGPSSADWRAHMNRPEVKEARSQAKEDRRRNKLKRQRAAAIKRGENINMRTMRLPGDPKLTS